MRVVPEVAAEAHEETRQAFPVGMMVKAAKEVAVVAKGVVMTVAAVRAQVA